MIRIALGLVFALTLAFGFASNASAQDAVNCDDIASQAEAQRIYEYDTNDPNGLDGPIGPNNDTRGTPGLACERPPYGSLTFEDYLVLIGAAPPAEEVPVEEAPVEEAPVEEAPVEEAPVEEAAPESTGGSTTLPNTGTGSMTEQSNYGLIAALMAAAGGFGLAALRTRRA